MYVFKRNASRADDGGPHTRCAAETATEASGIWRRFHLPAGFPGPSGLIVLLVLLWLGIFCPSPGICQEGPEGGVHSARSHRPGADEEINIGAWLATFFSRHISAVDGDRCPSQPTCSSYSAQAFRKHGFFVGWVMTVDRLIHEGDEGSVSPLVRRGNRLKILDPVENNDFWWYSKNGEDRD